MSTGRDVAPELMLSVISWLPNSVFSMPGSAAIRHHRVLGETVFAYIISRRRDGLVTVLRALCQVGRGKHVHAAMVQLDQGSEMLELAVG